MTHTALIHAMFLPLELLLSGTFLILFHQSIVDFSCCPECIVFFIVFYFVFLCCYMGDDD